MIRKSGYRFSEKIMLHQRSRARCQSHRALAYRGRALYPLAIKDLLIDPVIAPVRFQYRPQAKLIAVELVAIVAADVPEKACPRT